MAYIRLDQAGGILQAAPALRSIPMMTADGGHTGSLSTLNRVAQVADAPAQRVWAFAGHNGPTETRPGGPWNAQSPSEPAEPAWLPGARTLGAFGGSGSRAGSAVDEWLGGAARAPQQGGAPQYPPPQQFHQPPQYQQPQYQQPPQQYIPQYQAPQYQQPQYQQPQYQQSQAPQAPPVQQGGGWGGAAPPSRLNATTLAIRNISPLISKIGEPDLVDNLRGGIAIWSRPSLKKRGYGFLHRVEIIDEAVPSLTPIQHFSNIYIWFPITISVDMLSNVHSLSKDFYYDRKKELMIVRSDSLDTAVAQAALLTLYGKGKVNYYNIVANDLLKIYYTGARQGKAKVIKAMYTILHQGTQAHRAGQRR